MLTSAKNALRDRMPLEMLPLLAAWTVLRARLDEAREEGDRGDISISTVIIWVAVIAGAVLIAAALTALFTKYKGKVSGL